jgi:hypothetical protein
MPRERARYDLIEDLIGALRLINSGRETYKRPSGLDILGPRKSKPIRELLRRRDHHMSLTQLEVTHSWELMDPPPLSRQPHYLPGMSQFSLSELHKEGDR